MDFKTRIIQFWWRLEDDNPRQSSLISADQMTRRSWARKIASFDEIPDLFVPIANGLIPDKHHIPYMVLTPTFEGFLRRENEKLVICLYHKLYILENDRQGISVTSFAIDEINRLEFGKILLTAWFLIQGTNNTGMISTSLMRFNSVTDFLFYPIIESIRKKRAPAGQFDLTNEREKFTPLQKDNIKFMSYARNSLLSGEQVNQYFFQPELKIARLRIFGKTVLRRTICLTHLLIHTDHELIFIQEDESIHRLQDKERYGATWSYLPLSHIQDVAIETRSVKLSDLAIRLPGNEVQKMPFDITRKNEAEQFVHKIKQSIASSKDLTGLL
jgi:hypothetical protein